MPICQKCGKLFVEDAIFCPECRTHIFASSIYNETGFSGTYFLQHQGVTYTLILHQDVQGKISGILSSIRGENLASPFQVDGQIDGQTDGNIAVGLCHDSQEGVYFEARLEGNQLLLALIETDSHKMPDYSKVRQLVFFKQEDESAR